MKEHYIRRQYQLRFVTQEEKEHFENVLRNIKNKTGDNMSVNLIKAVENYWAKLK